MKYSNYVGVIACIILIGFCFVPWVYISAINTIITGISAPHTNFGKPGILHIILSIFSITLFLLPKVWAKRTNVFVATFNLAWSFRNFLLITQCEQGDCPEKKAGIYALIILSIIILIMAMLPKVSLKK